MKGESILAENLTCTPDELVARIRQGDREAFDELITMFESQVLRTAFYLTRDWSDASDVAQEVYLKLVQHLPRQGRISNLQGWVYRITVNAARDHQRRIRRWEPLKSISRRLWGESRVVGELEAEEFRGRLQQALARLSVNERAAFIFKEIQEMPTAEVAEILSCQPVTVRSHLSNARRKLRKYFQEFQKP